MNKNPETSPILVGECVRIFRRGRRWHARWQQNGKQHRQALETGSEKEARNRAVRIEMEIRAGTQPKTGAPIALEEAVERYKAFLQAEGRAKRTLAKYVKIFDRLLALAAKRRLRRLDQFDLNLMDAYRQKRAEEAAAPKTIYNESTILRQLVNFGLSRDWIGHDPLKGLRLRKPKRTEQPCWTPEQLESILAASRGSREHPLHIVLADTGMRVGEVRHLTWDDIDFGNNLIHVRPKDGWRPKTGDARSVPMSERVHATLKNQPRRNARWVFPSPTKPSSPFSDRTLLTRLKKLLKGLGLPGHVHTFRHAFISKALIAGVAESIVRAWVGHVDAEILRHYTHIANQPSQAAMQRLTAGENPNLQPEGRPRGVESDGRTEAQKQHNRGKRKNRQDASP